MGPPKVDRGVGGDDANSSYSSPRLDINSNQPRGTFYTASGTAIYWDHEELERGFIMKPICYCKHQPTHTRNGINSCIAKQKVAPEGKTMANVGMQVGDESAPRRECSAQCSNQVAALLGDVKELMKKVDRCTDLQENFTKAAKKAEQEKYQEDFGLITGRLGHLEELMQRIQTPATTKQPNMIKLEQEVADLQRKHDQVGAGLEAAQNDNEELSKQLADSQKAVSNLTREYRKMIKECLKFKTLFVKTKLYSSEVLSYYLGELEDTLDEQKQLLQLPEEERKAEARIIFRDGCSMSEYIQLKEENMNLMEEIDYLSTAQVAQDIFIGDLQKQMGHMVKILNTYQLSHQDPELQEVLASLIFMDSRMKHPSFCDISNLAITAAGEPTNSDATLAEIEEGSRKAIEKIMQPLLLHTNAIPLPWYEKAALIEPLILTPEEVAMTQSRSATLKDIIGISKPKEPASVIAPKDPIAAFAPKGPTAVSIPKEPTVISAPTAAFVQNAGAITEASTPKILSEAPVLNDPVGSSVPKDPVFASTPKRPSDKLVPNKDIIGASIPKGTNDAPASMAPIAASALEGPSNAFIPKGVIDTFTPKDPTGANVPKSAVAASTPKGMTDAVASPKPKGVSDIHTPQGVIDTSALKGPTGASTMKSPTGDSVPAPVRLIPPFTDKGETPKMAIKGTPMTPIPLLAKKAPPASDGAAKPTAYDDEETPPKKDSPRTIFTGTSVSLLPKNLLDGIPVLSFADKQQVINQKMPVEQPEVKAASSNNQGLGSDECSPPSTSQGVGLPSGGGSSHGSSIAPDDFLSIQTSSLPDHIIVKSASGSCTTYKSVPLSAALSAASVFTKQSLDPGASTSSAAGSLGLDESKQPSKKLGFFARLRKFFKKKPKKKGKGKNAAADDMDDTSTSDGSQTGSSSSGSRYDSQTSGTYSSQSSKDDESTEPESSLSNNAGNDKANT